MANAVVITAINLAELAGATLRASCMAANVMTMNVPLARLHYRRHHRRARVRHLVMDNDINLVAPRKARFQPWLQNMYFTPAVRVQSPSNCGPFRSW